MPGYQQLLLQALCGLKPLTLVCIVMYQATRSLGEEQGQTISGFQTARHPFIPGSDYLTNSRLHHEH